MDIFNQTLVIVVFYAGVLYSMSCVIYYSGKFGMMTWQLKEGMNERDGVVTRKERRWLLGLIIFWLIMFTVMLTLIWTTHHFDSVFNTVQQM